MTLRDIIEKIPSDKLITIYYITKIDLGDGEGEIDVFAGICEYENGELTSVDYDTYSLEDELVDYECTYNEKFDYYQLSVWYESEWI